MAPKLLLHTVSRQQGEEVDELTFELGVNLLVGPRNSGKTKWLQTIDYLFGDDIGAEERETDDIFQRYDSATLSFSIDEERFTVERRWKQTGLMSKVVVNGEAILLKEYRELLMNRLGIPIVHFPQGNPFGSRPWPELGWRTLFRHIYRQQRFWSTFADQQPESEQHACFMQFLGAAGSIFSPEFDTLIQSQKKVMTMEAHKEQFLSVLHQVTREVVHSEDLGVAITPASIEDAVHRLHAEQVKVQLEREQVLAGLRQAMPKAHADAVSELSNALVRVRAERESNTEALRKAEGRFQELSSYRKLLNEECGRMQRAYEGGSVLADLKVTHCPACDQEINGTPAQPDHCELCKQAVFSSNNSFQTAGRRVEFEVEQLQAEIAETDELLVMLERDVEKYRKEDAGLRANQAQVEDSLIPIRSASCAILPPELALFDMESGRIQEQLRQLQSVKSSLGYRDVLNQQIDRLQESIASLETPVSTQRGEIDFHQLGDLMSDGMNTYLNAIDKLKPGAYPQREVRFTLSDRGFRVKVGDGRWDRKLGGTQSLYFLLAYHYALLRLTTVPNCHYPGLAILDFPAELPDLVDEENFLIIPFIELLWRDDMGGTQLIIAGTGFVGLEGVHRLELPRVWN